MPMKQPKQHKAQLQVVHDDQPQRYSLQAWENFVRRVGQRLQIDLTQPGKNVMLASPGTERKLMIASGTGCVAFAFCETTGKDLQPEVEIVFDTTDERGWSTDEVHYAPEIWNHFVSTIHRLGQDDTDAQYIGFDQFVGYVLEQVDRDGGFIEMPTR